MTTLNIVRPGLFTTVQDLGRWGFQSRGVPIAGAMDQYSHRLANLLVGNPPDAATLEVTLMGPSVEFGGPAMFAVSGAAFRLTLDDAPVEMNRAVEARAGARLRFGDRLRGARAYLAVGGGVDVPRVLHSRSTHVATGMGGHEGRALKAGDVLRCGSGHVRPRSSDRIAALPIPLADGGAKVRVVEGAFADGLAGQRFRISTQSNRMGYRLEGTGTRTATPAGLLSSAVPTGAIQMPPSGQPILLMADHATTGGYAVAATVVAADLPIAAQLAPGDWIEFEPCSLEAADRAHDAREQSLGGLAA